MGIPFPATLGTVAAQLAQVRPIPVPRPAPGPAAGHFGDSGAGADRGLDSLPRDRSRERERPCKCPPEKSGEKVQRNHNMNPEPRRYQARITEFEYGIVTGGNGNETSQGWNMEWEWLGTDFDGFQPAQCLLQEAKGNYDQFIGVDDKPKPFFAGFKKMTDQIIDQGTKVRANPPARLMWYFQTPKTRQYMLSTLRVAGVPSVNQP
ncbi:hypothetical protein OKW43_004701 [Paraburkholderia sp. WC7.3g]